MNYRSNSGTKSHGPRRLVTTLIAICLPVLAATFFSGSFFKVGTLQPGEVLDASAEHVAHAASSGHTAHGASTVPGAPTLLTEVSIQNYAFHTQSITINVGDTVRWTNLDPDRHTSTSSDGLWDSGELAQNGTFAFTFTAPGTFNYYCARHSGMTGTITVVGSSTSTPQTTATGTPGTTATPGGTGTPSGTGTPGATTTGTPQPVCTPTGSISVSITESGFSPASVTVNPGTRVTWTNNGTSRHRVRDINHTLFDSDDLYPGQSFSYTFCNSGYFAYEDSRTSYTGSVTVSGTPSTNTPGSTTTGTPGTTGTPAATDTPTPSGNIVDVSMMRHDVFSPASITIQTGTTVRWTNMDDEQHTTTSDTGVWNSGALNPGQQFMFTFLEPGTYPYACLFHQSEMRGTIVVTGPAISPTPGPSQTAQPTATPGSGTVDVAISNYAFSPQNLTISVGTTVRWTNNDSAPHTSTCDTAVWNSGTLNQGGQYSFTFTTPGTYTYHCDIHSGMRGTITVTSGGAGTPTATAQASNTPGTTGTAQTTPTSQPTGTAQVTATTRATASATPVPQVVQVLIQSYAYSPNSVTISAGTRVRWTNMDNDMHSVTSNASPRLFDSGEFAQNGTWEYLFNTPGTYTYFCTVHGSFMSGTVIVTAAPTATSTPAPGQVFNDVFPSDYFYTPANWLATRGIISGYADGSFKPYNNTTRSQVTKIVALGEGWALANPAQPTFQDVPRDNPFYQYVETAVQHGVISGYGDGTFKPYNNVTRGQLTKIIVLGRNWTLLNPGQPTFQDVPTTDAFYKYIETAVSKTIISGYADNTFRPGNNATRGQVSKILYNALNVAP